MTVWEICGGVATVLGILAFFMRPIIKLNTSITSLSEAVKTLIKCVDKNDECHKEFAEQLGDHKTRITVLEDWRQGVK